MNTKDEKHSGHRIRLRNLINDVGLKKLSDIQIVEQILTMSHCRKNTNNIAHDLLNKFGTIANILDASSKDLTEVEGVGKVSADYITYLPQIFEIYTSSKNNMKKANKGEIFNCLRPKFSNSCETVYACFINKFNYISGCIKLAEGDFKKVKFDLSKIADKIIASKDKKIIFAHNHPYGTPYPSESDYDTNNYLSSLLKAFGVEVIDSIIIDNNGYYSCVDNIYYELNKNN